MVFVSEAVAVVMDCAVIHDVNNSSSDPCLAEWKKQDESRRWLERFSLQELTRPSQPHRAHGGSASLFIIEAEDRQPCSAQAKASLCIRLDGMEAEFSILKRMAPPTVATIY